MNGKQFKEFLNKKVKQENIGRAAGITQDAEKIYQGLQNQYNDFVKQTQSGKALSQQDLRIYRLALADLQKLTPLTGFDTATKKQLNQINQNLKDGTDILQNYNKNVLAREAAYRKLDEVKKKQTGNFLFGYESEKDKTADEREQLKKQSIALKDEISKYDAAIAPYLDVKTTKKQLDNTSFFDLKAHARAKTDYQNAREMKTGREAEEWLQDKEVKQLSVQAGTAAAAQETIDSSGNKANLKAAKEARTFTQNREKLKSTIKGRGYKDSDDELDKLVDEIIRRGKMDVTEKQQSDINKKLQEYTKAHPVIGSFAAAAAGTVAKVPGAKYALSQAIKGFISDERVYNDPNSAYFFGSNAYNQVTTAVKDEIAKHIENKYDDPEVIKSKIKDAQMMYDGAMSGLENIIRAVTTAGVGEAYALVPMALAQLSDIALQKTIEGYSPTDAGYYAFIGAVAEYATEKMGIDALFSKVPGGRNIIVGYLTKLFKVGAAEGAEEVVSDVINDAADCLYEFLSDKKSVREKEISHLMREGLSYKEAAEAYTHNKINEYIDDAVMGAAVGAVLGGGSTAVNITAKTANIARNLSASKQQAQAANQQTVNAIQAEFGGRLTAEAAADVAKERGQWIYGNAYYENLIEQAKNSYDPKVAQMGIDAEDDYRYQKQMKDGRVSIAKAGRLINHISAANIRATTGMATQMLESVGAKSGTVKAVVNAINGEELSRRDIKNIKNSPDALYMLSQLYQDNTGEAIFLSAESDNDTIREVAGAVQGASFNIDRNTDAGKMYSMAAGLRSENKLGFNGVQGFVNSYSPDLGLDDEGYSLMYQQAYSLAKSNEYSNMQPEEKSRAIADAMTEDFLEGIDNVQMYARVAAISSAVADAQNDVSLERKKSKETSEAEAEPDEDATQKEDSALEEDTSESDPVTKEAVESAKKLSRLSESEKAEKFKNGGAIVESKQKLSTQQSAIMSFYDYRGKKHGITYRFVDSIESNERTRGEYNHQTEVITIRIGEVADMTSTAGHELGHWLKAHYPEEYARMQQYLKDTVFKTNYEAKVAAKIAAYKKADITIDEEAAFEELTNDSLFGVDMASSEYEEFVRANETLMQKAFRVIRELLQDLQHFMEDWRKQLPEMYKQVTEIKMVQELYADVEFMEYTADWVDRILNKSTVSEQSAASEQTTDAGEQKNSTTAESGVLQYSIADDTGKEETKPASKLSEKDFRDLLERAFIKREFGNDTYIPMRAHTPQFFREVIAEFTRSEEYDGEPVDIKDLPMAMQVSHVIQCMEEDDGNGSYAHRPHDLSEDNMVEISKAMNKPSYIVLQSNGRFAEVVSIRDKKTNKKIVVSIDYATSKTNYRRTTEINGYDEGYYNIIVTQYQPDSLKRYLNQSERIIYDKEKMNGKYQVGSGRVVTFTHDIPFINNSISDDDENINKSFQISDADYLEAARNGDEEKATEYVEQAAKEWGAFSDGKPEPINFYHGTKSFGFTEFDLQKMDDKRSIFLTSDEVTAQSYSSVMGKRKISDSPKPIDYRNMSKKELVDALNEYSVFNDEYDVDYTYLSKEQIDSLIASKTEEIEELRDMLTEELRDSSMPQQKSDSIHRLLKIVREGTTGQITANLYMATNSKSNAYLDVAKYESIYDRIYRISLFEDTDKDISDGAIMETMGTGYYEIIPEKEAKGILKNWSSNTAGNYSLYAKFNNPFVIDNEGRLWRDIKLNEKSAEQLRSQEQRDAIKRMREFISGLEKDSEWTDEGFYSDNIFKSDKIGRETRSHLIQFMTDAYNGEFVTDNFPWGEYKEKIVFASDMLRLNNAFDYDTSYTTREIAEKAQKAGYDGVVFKNIRDNGGRGMKDPGVTDYIAVAFDSAQVKSADPTTYDDNGEIIPLSERFSDSKDIRFQVADTVEETKDLVAVHNMHESELLKSLDLGGMPMPSIAVMKAKESGTNSAFGEVSLVFPRNTIDPINSKENKLYGADAWTPTYPKVGYKLSKNKIYDIDSRAHKIKGEPFYKSVDYDKDNILSRLESSVDYNEFIKNESDRYDNKQLFLYETTGETVPMQKKKVETVIDVDYYEALRKELNPDVFENLPMDKWANKYHDSFEHAVLNALKIVNPSLTERQAYFLMDHKYPYRMSAYSEVQKLKKYIESSGSDFTTEQDDINATKRLIDERINTSEYKKWINDFYSGLVEKKGIRNNKKWYTESGNARSFESLHYEYKLENVVKAMKEQRDKGQSFVTGFGFWGAATKNYRSIDELKADENRLKNIDPDDYIKIKEQFSERLQEIRTVIIDAINIDNKKEFDGYTLAMLDNSANELIVEGINKSKTKSGLKRYWQQNVNKPEVITDTLIEDFVSLLDDIYDMPVGYFEAKPQRGVSFNEVYTAVIPDNASADLIAALDKAGVKYQTYEAGNEEDRVRVINSLDEVKFQISDTTLTPEQQAAIERKATRREMAKLERENENLKAALDAALKQTKLSKDFCHDKSKTTQIAKKLLRKFGVRDVEEGDYRFNRFVDALNKFYDTIDDSKLEGTGGSDVTYMAALEAIESVRDSLEETDYTNADYLRDFLSDIGTPDSQGRIRYIYLNEDAARSVLENYGSFRNVISHTGNIHFKSLQPGESHATLDEIWESEIAGKWGDVVTGASEMSTDGLINLTDSTMQAQVLINAIENARDVVQGRNTYNPLGDKTAFEAADEIIDGEATSDESYIINEMIMDLFESYNDAEWQATFADKKANKERVKYLQYKSKLRQSMDRYRRQVNERNETYRKKIEKNYQERYNKAISRNDLRVQMEKERLAAYKEKVAENRKKATERKKQTEIKNKIRKMALELARLGGDPNKKKHLPNGLVKVTKEFLELIDTGDRNNGKLSQYVYNINTEFARIEGHPGYDALSDSYNNMIKGQIEEIAVEIGHKNLNELTSSELQKVWECAKTIKHSVVHMNRFFLAEKNATPEQYQQRLLQERKGKDSKKELVAAMGLKRFIDNDLKPYYFFNKLQSPTMNKLYDALRTGQDTWATDIQEGEDAIVAFKEKYNYNSWDQRKMFEFKLESGQTIKLNLQQIMSLRAYADREASFGHIYIGGIKLRSGTEATRHFKDKVTQRIDNTRYEISPADLEKITRSLTQEQTNYVIAMRNYLSSLGEKGNQVSRALFDLELFRELNYFPMRSSQDYTRQGEYKEVGEKKLKNWGNSKPLVPGADNPIVIEEFNDVWARHVNEMALYHAFTLPLEDFQKVYGYYKVVKPAEEKELRKNFSDEKAFEEHMPTTASIRNLFSVSEQQYISQFLRNLNGGVKKADNTLSGRGIAKYKKMSTALNLRVAVQQPGAIARAFLYINPKYFAKTAGKGFTGFKSDSKTVQEMEKYSGAAFIKSMGYFDVDTGKTAEEFLLESGDNYKGAQKVKGFFFDGKYRDSLLLMGPEVMDRITWVQIWEATKAKVAAEEGLTGKALLKRTGKVFSDVVDKTQVYDSVFTRSGHMRSTDALAKMATSFMAEPTTTINMIYDAVTQYRAGKVNKKFVAGAFASCFTATLFTNLLASVVSAMRHGKKDDNWWELWTGEFTADALNDIILLNSLPIVRDIYNLAKGFDIERADMTLISDWVSSVQKLNEASQKGKLTYKEWINFMSSSAVMLGFPFKSLYKDINGIFTAYQIVTNGTSPTREGIRKAIKKGTLDTLVADDFLPIAQPSTNKYDTIYLLYAGGNKKEAEKRKKILFKYDEKATQEKLDAYIKGQLKENKDVIRAADALKSGDLSKTKSELSKIKNFDKEIVLKAMVQIVNDQVNDEEEKVGTDTLVKVSSQKTLEQNVLLNNKLVRQAAIALNKNDDEARYNAQKQLVNQGFKINDVVKATRTIKNKMFPSEKKDDTSSEKGMKYFQYADVADALKANKPKFARDVVKKLESDYAKDGKSAADVHKQVRSKITSTFKEEYYMANESRRAEIRKLMWASGAYDSVDDVTKACKKWVKDVAKKKYSN